LICGKSRKGEREEYEPLEAIIQSNMRKIDRGCLLPSYSSRTDPLSPPNVCRGGGGVNSKTTTKVTCFSVEECSRVYVHDKVGRTVLVCVELTQLLLIYT